MKAMRHHWELNACELSVEAAMEIFSITKNFPKEEMYSLTDRPKDQPNPIGSHPPAHFPTC